MGRRKKSDNPAEATDIGTTATQPISKMAAVREALAQGVESPSEIVSYVKEKHGLDMTTAHVSAYKSQIKKPKNGAKRGRPKKVAFATPAESGNGSGKAHAGNGLLADVKSVRDLVKRLGAGQVKELVGLFE
jgi:hypothetical protein